AQALGYRAASNVRSVTSDLDAIKLHCIKQIIDQHPRGPGYYPLALVGPVDPITDSGAAVCGVESVKANGADNAAAEDNERLEPPVADKFLERAAYPLAGVLD